MATEPSTPPTNPAMGHRVSSVLALLLLAATVSIVVALFTHTWGWTIFLALCFVGLAWLANRQPLSPRTKRAVRYAGRTAERAAIWWGVSRTLNGLFGLR
jgi:hypothetical protein